MSAAVLIGEILERAAELAGVHGLRAYGSVQLASALAARQADRRCGALATFDRELLRAALSEGIEDATAPAARGVSSTPPLEPTPQQRRVEGEGSPTGSWP